MPINEESKKEYLEARDVFVESYKDFLRKLLGLLDEAESSTGDAEVRRDVVHFADEVKILKKHIDDFKNEEERAKRLASSEGTPRDGNQDFGRASSPGERPESAQDQTPVPLGGGLTTTTTTSTSQQKTKTQSAESADELQAEVESAPSQLSQSDDAADEAPQVFAPAMDDDGRVVSAFCAFRYHKAEFRQLFMRQGSNNSCLAAAAAAAAAARDAAIVNNASSAFEGLLDPGTSEPPVWLAPLAQYTLHLMRRAFRTATTEQWEALKTQLAGFGFKAEEHFAMWLRLSANSPNDLQGQQDPARVFDAIPPLAGLPKRLATETKIMLQTLNLLSD